MSVREVIAELTSLAQPSQDSLESQDVGILISVNVDNALGEKLKTGDRRLYAKEAAEILLASPNVLASCGYDMLPTLCRYAGDKDRTVADAITAVVQGIAGASNAAEVFMGLMEHVSGLLTSCSDNGDDESDAEEGHGSDDDSDPAKRRNAVAGVVRLIPAFSTSLGRMTSSRRAKMTPSACEVLGRLTSLLDPIQYNGDGMPVGDKVAVQEGVELISEYFVRMASFIDAIRQCSEGVAAIGMISEERWVVMKLATEMLSLAASFPLAESCTETTAFEGVGEEAAPVHNISFWPLALRLANLVDRLGGSPLHMARHARHQQGHTRILPADPCSVAAAHSNYSLNMRGVAVYLYVRTYAAGCHDDAPQLWPYALMPSHTFWLLTPYVPLLLRGRWSGVYGGAKALRLLGWAAQSVPFASLLYEDKDADDVDIVALDGGEYTDAQLVQDLLSFAMTCPSTALQSHVTSLVAIVTDCFEPASRLRMALDLLASCPHGSASAVMINVVKGSMSRAADGGEDMTKERATFWSEESRKVLPLALRLEADYEVEGKYDAIMSGLNLLQYIMMHDMGANNTGIWDSPGDVDLHLLTPLAAAVQRQLDRVLQTAGDHPPGSARGKTSVEPRLQAVRLELLLMRIEDVRNVIDLNT